MQFLAHVNRFRILSPARVVAVEALKETGIESRSKECVGRSRLLAESVICQRFENRLWIVLDRTQQGFGGSSRFPSALLPVPQRSDIYIQ